MCLLAYIVLVTSLSYMEYSSLWGTLHIVLCRKITEIYSPIIPQHKDLY